MPLRVILADDQEMVRQGIKLLLEREMGDLRIVGEASDGREAVRLAQELRPDVAVLDLAMPVLNGLDAAREIRRHVPLTKTILLTVHAEDRRVMDALRAGINGYVLKTQPPSELAQAIQEVARGAVYLSPAVSRAVVDAYLAAEQSPAGRLPGERLTPRERQVLQLVAEGKTTKEIATILGVSVKTSESHRTRVMHKLGIHTAAGLVRYAIREGLVNP
ncbi:MAG TPA: response regulator transcription factor [Gemmatimonadales bacterium]|jgi:DNA-binding NarL/FixJ family response regulator|nr:response regulator transcription factor [Gemmatimonadales bacterium]